MTIVKCAAMQEIAVLRYPLPVSVSPKFWAETSQVFQISVRRLCGRYFRFGVRENFPYQHVLSDCRILAEKLDRLGCGWSLGLPPPEAEVCTKESQLPVFYIIVHRSRRFSNST